MALRDIELDVLTRMHQNGLVAGRYRSIQDVRRSIGWQRIASRHHEKTKFDSLARKLVKKGLLTDHGKSMRVLSLTPAGVALVNRRMADHGTKS